MKLPDFILVSRKTNSLLSRCSTARGSISWLSLGGPTKVKNCKTFLFTECSLKVENKKHFISFQFAKMHYEVAKCHSQLCQIVGFSKDFDQNGDMVS